MLARNTIVFLGILEIFIRFFDLQISVFVMGQGALEILPWGSGFGGYILHIVLLFTFWGAISCTKFCSQFCLPKPCTFVVFVLTLLGSTGPGRYLIFCVVELSRGMSLKACLGRPWAPRCDHICKNMYLYRDQSGYQCRR